jgi:hypothetical protein
MAEVLAEFSDVVVGENRVHYHAHACGAPRADGTWQGWLEFVPMDGGEPIRSGRETTQPNRTDTAYWATGLTSVYLAGALQRALNPLVASDVATDTPIFNEPAPPVHTTVMPVTLPDAVVDPFSVYEKEGEALLRRRLAALAAWHLVNIVAKFELSEETLAVLSRLPAEALTDRIVAAVRSERSRAGRHTAR